MDAILVPAAARAGREDEKRATVAVNEVAIGIPFLANSRREDRISILRATGVRDAFHADGRHNGGVGTEREAAKDRQAEDCEVEAAGVSGGAAALGQAQATNQRLRARYAATSFAADLHPGALERVSPALEATSETARKQVQAMRVQKGVARRARTARCANAQRQPNAAAALRQEAVGRCDHGWLQREGREVIAGVPALLVEQERLSRRRQRREQSVERVALSRVRRDERMETFSHELARE